MSKWDIADGGISTLSELKWRNLKILQLGLSSQVLFPNDFMIIGDIKVGKILGGESQDSDYNFSGRQGEWSRSLTKVKGHSFDVSIGVGRRFTASPTLEITPLIGLEYNSLTLKDYDARQVVSGTYLQGGVESPPVGWFRKGLVATYKPQTYGAWLGTQGTYHVSSRLSLSGLAKIHFTRYEGRGNWILRTDLAHPVSFKDYKNGIGYSGKVRVDYAVKAGLTFFTEVEYKTLPLKNGQKKAYLANGATHLQKVNDIKWNSASIMTGFSWKF